MKKIIIKFDYRCFPIWIYEGNDLVDNDLPSELLDDKMLDETLVKLQEEYDNLFTDNNFLFEFRGFSDKKQEEKFILKVSEVEQELFLKLGDKYIIENEVNINSRIKS